MMPLTKVFGLDALEIGDPKGEVQPYLVKSLTPPSWFAAQWSLTSPKGSVYTVSRRTDGTYECDCPANGLGKNRGGRWCEIAGQKVCKHIWNLHHELCIPEPSV